MRDRASRAESEARPELTTDLQGVRTSMPTSAHRVERGLGLIVRVEVPIRTVSVNHREHHYARASRVRSQQEAVLMALRPLGVPRAAEDWPLDVHLTRLASKRLDSDNLSGAFKAIRDAVAKWLGVDDRREDIVDYHCHQELCAAGHHQLRFTAGGTMRKIHEGRVRIEICRRLT
jgi:hypothetical protein